MHVDSVYSEIHSAHEILGPNMHPKHMGSPGGYADILSLIFVCIFITRHEVYLCNLCIKLE